MQSAATATIEDRRILSLETLPDHEPIRRPRGSEKTKTKRRDHARLSDYRPRPDSMQRRTNGGRS